MSEPLLSSFVLRNRLKEALSSDSSVADDLLPISLKHPLSKPGGNVDLTAEDLDSELATGLKTNLESGADLAIRLRSSNQPSASAVAPDSTPLPLAAAAVSTEWWCIDLGQGVSYSAAELARFSEACFRFTPDVVVGHNRIFLEMSRTKKLFSLDSVQKRAQVLSDWTSAHFKEQSLLWKWGIGKTLPQAWVQTRWKNSAPQVLPIESIFDFIDPLGKNSFAAPNKNQGFNRRDQERVQLFYALGIRTVSDLFKLPPDALLTRFGEVLDQFSKNYHEGSRFPWVRYTSALDLVEQTRWNPEEWVIDSESLIFRIKPLVECLMSRLFSLRRSLKKLEITLKLDSRAEDRKIVLQFAFPQTSSQLLLRCLREKLSFEMQKNPLADPIVAASFAVLETCRRDETSLRFQFSEENEHGTSEDLREKWMELISYLSMEHGKNVFQAETTEHPLPEQSWKKVLLSDPVTHARLDQVSHLYPKRPMRLLSDPIVLRREGMFLRQQHKFENWRICEFACEERMNGYEWDVDGAGGFDRTYYRVRVQMISGTPIQVLQGEEPTQDWWVYKDEVLNKLILHGVYE